MEVGAFCMITDYYTQTFTVERPSTNKSAIGGYNPTFTSAGTFKGWIDYLSGQEVKTGMQWIDDATHIIGCSSTNTWVLDSDRIKDADGLYFRVLHRDNPVIRNHHLEILLAFKQSDQLST